MSKTATKDTLLRQVAELEKTVRSMNEPKVLRVYREHTISHLDMYSGRGRLDLRMVDDIRRHLQHTLAHQLADELIRTGAVKFEETLEDDLARFGKAIRIKAELIHC